ncbi:hypothetical protein [Spongiimicrobium sp. 2-473A-2-J]|uniref:hypothetical protein n=1 Tax=Eudoraea algarum TaxID=3417568 RepID=UPI003D3610CA
MKTRKNFLDWVGLLPYAAVEEINQPKFFNIHEREYVYKVLDQVMTANPNVKAFVRDYGNLEDQRYQIMDTYMADESRTIAQINAAIRFCSKSEREQRQGNFIVNPELSDFLVQSNFLWDGIGGSYPEMAQTHYLCIPSFLPLAPKELCLTDLRSLLLDIMAYRETFNYDEFLSLVADAMALPKQELDEGFLEFVSNQVLYYRTLLPIN